VFVAFNCKGGLTTSVSNFGSLDATGKQGVQILSQTGGFNIAASTSLLDGMIVGISSGDNYTISAGSTIEITSATTTIRFDASTLCTHLSIRQFTNYYCYRNHHQQQFNHWYQLGCFFFH
jgi:hypothetical protein